MIPKTIDLIDVVALTDDLPEYGLKCGQVGTVVEFLGNGNAFEVEFCYPDGRTYQSVGLCREQIMLLYFEPEVSMLDAVAA